MGPAGVTLADIDANDLDNDGAPDLAVTDRAGNRIFLIFLIFLIMNDA